MTILTRHVLLCGLLLIDGTGIGGSARAQAVPPPAVSVAPPPAAVAIPPPMIQPPPVAVVAPATDSSSSDDMCRNLTDTEKAASPLCQPAGPRQ